MNISHVLLNFTPGFQDCIKLQKELVKKYQEFDSDCQDIKEIDSRESQDRIRALLMRAVEEYSEAIESDDLVHKEEEFADSLIFLLELEILLSINLNWEADLTVLNPPDIIPVLFPLKYLRNKKWKRTGVPADFSGFKKDLETRILEYFSEIYSQFPNILTTMYKKMIVNRFRIETRY